LQQCYKYHKKAVAINITKKKIEDKWINFKKKIVLWICYLVKIKAELKLQDATGAELVFADLNNRCCSCWYKSNGWW
jgi:hypothetical protein